MARIPPYKALDIAKYILSIGDVVTNLKLQKLLYYAQAFYLVKNESPLFEDEIEAWQYGPVVRSVYEKYKEHGSCPIEGEASEELEVLDKETQDYMDNFLKKYMNYSASDLVSMIHNEDPWLEVYYKEDPKEDKFIKIESMKEYYSKPKKFLGFKIDGDIATPLYQK